MGTSPESINDAIGRMAQDSEGTVDEPTAPQTERAVVSEPASGEKPESSLEWARRSFPRHGRVIANRVERQALRDDA